MQLAEWRKANNMSCDDLAKALGFAGDRDGARVWNWETGRARPDADQVERITVLTDGQVAATDMHMARLQWLQRNRPEKFSEAPARAEAAE